MRSGGSLARSVSAMLGSLISFAVSSAPSFPNQPVLPGSTILEYGGEIPSTVTLPTPTAADYHPIADHTLICQKRTWVAEVRRYINAEQPNPSLIESKMGEGRCTLVGKDTRVHVKRFEAFTPMDGREDLALFSYTDPDFGVPANYYIERSAITLDGRAP